MKKVKRILSLMLAVAMVVTTLGVVTVSTIAENGETPLHEYEWVTVHSESFDGGISTENSGLYTIAEGVTPDYSTGAFVGENLANKKALTLNVTTLPNWKKLLTEAKSVRYSFEAGWSKAGGNELSTTVTIPGLTGVETKPMVRTKSTGSGFEYCVPGMTSDAYKYSGYAGAANPRYEILVNSDGSGYLKAMQSDYPSPTLDVSFEAGKAPSFTLGDKYGLIYVGFDLEQDKFLIDNVKIEVLVEKNYRWNTFFSEDFSTGGINADNADVLTVGSGITDASYANGFFTATNKAGCDSLTLDLTKDAEWATTLANAQEIIYNFDVHVVTGGQNYQTAVGIPALNGGYLTAINKNNTSTASAYVQHYPKGGSDTGGWIYNTAPYTYEVRVDKTGNGQMKVFVQNQNYASLIVPITGAAEFSTESAASYGVMNIGYKKMVMGKCAIDNIKVQVRTGDTRATAQSIAVFKGDIEQTGKADVLSDKIKLTFDNDITGLADNDIAVVNASDDTDEVAFTGAANGEKYVLTLTGKLKSGSTYNVLVADNDFTTEGEASFTVAKLDEGYDGEIELNWQTVHYETFDSGISTENAALYTVGNGANPDYSAGTFVGTNVDGVCALVLDLTKLPNWAELISDADEIRYSFDGGWADADGNGYSTSILIPAVTGSNGNRPTVKTAVKSGNTTPTGFEYSVPGMTGDAWQSTGPRSTAKYTVVVKKDGTGYLQAMQSGWDSPTLNKTISAAPAFNTANAANYGKMYVGFFSTNGQFAANEYKCSVDNIKVEIGTYSSKKPVISDADVTFYSVDGTEQPISAVSNAIDRIEIDFARTMDASTLDGNIFVKDYAGNAVPTTIDYANGVVSVNFAQGTILEKGGVYTLYVTTAVKNTSNLGLDADYVLTFKAATGKTGATTESIICDGVAVDDIADFVKGKALSVNVVYENTNEQASDMTVIVAYYNGDAMKSVGAKVVENLAAGQVSEIPVEGFTVPDVEFNTVKVFVLDNWNNLKPLSEVVMYPAAQ